MSSPHGVRGPFSNDEYTVVCRLVFAVSESDLSMPALLKTAERITRQLQGVASTRARRQRPQRKAAVCTGSSHSAVVAASRALTVIEQPAISSEVT